jgi:hypothetical protein
MVNRSRRFRQTRIKGDAVTRSRALLPLLAIDHVDAAGDDDGGAEPCPKVAKLAEDGVA